MCFSGPIRAIRPIIGNENNHDHDFVYVFYQKLNPHIIFILLVYCQDNWGKCPIHIKSVACIIVLLAHITPPILRLLGLFVEDLHMFLLCVVLFQSGTDTIPTPPLSLNSFFL